ncbi:MAG: glycosyltransferase family 4 protein [Pseudomonadota bacterium]
MKKIAVILPKGEGFSDDSFGAISLCIKDFTLNSKYKDDITVLGGIDLPAFAGINYQTMKPTKWYENRTRSYAKNCAKFINRNNINLVEIQNRPCFVKLLTGRVNCKIALHLHNDPLEMDSARTIKERMQLLKICDAIYCVSDYIKKRFMEGLEEQYSAKIHVVYNGIELTNKITEKQNIILFAGRMTEGKGALLLAQALNICLPKLPEWKAVFIGSRRHQAGMKLTLHEQEIYSTLSPLGKQAEMVGFLSHNETMNYFAISNIAVIPSIWQEPFGRTAIEAMSRSCALISSGTGGLLEITANAALTIRNLTPENLARNITELALDSEKRKELKEKAKTRAALFDIKVVTARLDEIREKILL